MRFERSRIRANLMITWLKKYLDVKKVLTAVLFIVAGYGMTVLNSAATAHEMGVEAHRLLVGDQAKNTPGVIQLLNEIKDEVQDMNRRLQAHEMKEYFVYNAVADVGNFGTSMPFVMVNELGIAQIYRSETHMKITNMSSPHRESLIFRIQGTFRDEQATHAIKISRRAASMLGIEDSTAEIHVEIAPVESDATG